MNKTAEEVCKSKLSFKRRLDTAEYCLNYLNSPYKCKVCGMWHTTKNNQNRARHFARLMLLRTLRTLIKVKKGEDVKDRLLL